MKRIALVVFMLIFATACYGLSDKVDVSGIPQFGAYENMEISQGRALAFAYAIYHARIDSWGFSFDTLYPVLIDIVGDGAPLLLLICAEDHSPNQWGGLPLHPPLLFGYASGELQPIVAFDAIGITEKNGEKLLTTGWVTDFGGSYYFYRIENGVATQVYAMEFFADWHRAEPLLTINGEQVSQEVYLETLNSIPTQTLIAKGHPGNTEATALLEPYLIQPFTREGAMRLFAGIHRL